MGDFGNGFDIKGTTKTFTTEREAKEYAEGLMKRMKAGEFKAKVTKSQPTTAPKKATGSTSKNVVINSQAKLDKVNKALDNASEGFSNGKRLTAGFIDNAYLRKGGELVINAGRKTYNERDTGFETTLTIDNNRRVTSGELPSRYDYNKEVEEVIKVVNKNGGIVKKVVFRENTWGS